MQGDAFACYQTDFRPLLRPILLRVIPVETRNSRYTAEPLRHRDSVCGQVMPSVYTTLSVNVTIDKT